MRIHVLECLVSPTNDTSCCFDMKSGTINVACTVIF